MTILPVKSKQQQRAEAEVADFKNDLGPFVVATEATRTAMAFTDARARDNPFIFVNNSFLALTGFAREDVLGQSFRFIMAHPEDENGRALLNSEFNESSDFSAEMCFRRKDGSTFWAAVFVCPVRDKDGLTVQYFASFVDVTEQREEQTQSKMLMDELNHRVKNTLATVQSIIWHALRIPSDRNTIREAIEPRLFAMARSHDLLTRENWKSVGLLDVVRDTLDPFEVAIGKKETNPPFSSFTWTKQTNTGPVNIGNSSSVSISDSGRYILTVINPRGCAASTNVTVTTPDQTPPVISVIGSLEFCIGDSVKQIGRAHV